MINHDELSSINKVGLVTCILGITLHVILKVSKQVIGIGYVRDSVANRSRLCGCIASLKEATLILASGALWWRNNC